MVRIVFVSPGGSARDIDAAPGTSVMVAAITNGIDGIEAECGGAMSCATCHVYVCASFGDRLPPPDAAEDAMLDDTAAERRAGSRLSCQITVTDALDGLVLHLPERQT